MISEHTSTICLGMNEKTFARDMKNNDAVFFKLIEKQLGQIQFLKNSPEMIGQAADTLFLNPKPKQKIEPSKTLKNKRLILKV